jgi:cytochrome c-type biogenesis protein CcmH/NrfG
MNPHTETSRWEAVEEAVELLHEEQPDVAIPMLRATLEGDPGNAYAHFYLGTALVAKSQHGPALVAFSEAERRNPDYLGAVVARGWCLQLRAEDADALWLLAVCLSEIGDKPRALGCVERFLKTNPSVESRHEAEALRAALQGRVSALDP